MKKSLAECRISQAPRLISGPRSQSLFDELPLFKFCPASATHDNSSSREDYAIMFPKSHKLLLSIRSTSGWGWRNVIKQDSSSFASFTKTNPKRKNLARISPVKRRRNAENIFGLRFSEKEKKKSRFSEMFSRISWKLKSSRAKAIIQDSNFQAITAKEAVKKLRRSSKEIKAKTKWVKWSRRVVLCTYKSFCRCLKSTISSQPSRSSSSCLQVQLQLLSLFSLQNLIFHSVESFNCSDVGVVRGILINQVVNHYQPSPSPACPLLKCYHFTFGHRFSFVFID
jgi:hypothetical protein